MFLICLSYVKNVYFRFCDRVVNNNWVAAFYIFVKLLILDVFDRVLNMLLIFFYMLEMCILDV